MKIAIGNDHSSYKVKAVVLKWLEAQKYQYKNFGNNSPFIVDYYDFVYPVAKAIENGEFNFGILIYGSDEGVSFAANKYRGIRAALCWSKEISQFAREHNNANVLCLPGIFLSDNAVIGILESFFNTPFAGEKQTRELEKVLLESL